jgi:hypothetical protein
MAGGKQLESNWNGDDEKISVRNLFRKDTFRSVNRSLTDTNTMNTRTTLPPAEPSRTY